MAGPFIILVKIILLKCFVIKLWGLRDKFLSPTHPIHPLQNVICKKKFLLLVDADSCECLHTQSFSG